MMNDNQSCAKEVLVFTTTLDIRQAPSVFGKMKCSVIVEWYPSCVIKIERVPLMPSGFVCNTLSIGLIVSALIGIYTPNPHLDKPYEAYYQNGNVYH